MGNHQFGLFNRPPEFIGKSWSYITEKRRKSRALNRPNSTVNFLDPRQLSVNDDRAGVSDVDSYRSRRGSSAPSETPTKSSRTKRRGSLKQNRAMARCSPTVPDALTLSLDVAASGLGVVGLSTAANADNEAVASALSAIKKLSPAAPRLFQEPIFDEFFEEAERRNQTMEALQAALISPSTSASVEEHNSKSSTEKTQVQRKSLGSTSGMISMESNCSEYSSHLIDPERITSAEVEGPLSPNSKSRLVVIVTGVGGSGTAKVDGESIDTDGRWGNLPPTIIVQPAPRPLFSSPSSSGLNSTNSAMTTTSSCLISGGLTSGRSPAETRRSSGTNQRISPNSNAATSTAGSLSVRFADQTRPNWFSESEDIADSCSSNTSSDFKGQKRRSHIRRKTIGVLPHLSLLADSATMSEPESSDSSKVTMAALSLSRLPQRQDEHRPSATVQQAPLRKKSLSKSDLLCPPPIITLLKQPQIILIRQLWQQLYSTKGPTVLGNHIFQRVFFKNPQIKDVFRTMDSSAQHYNVDCMWKAHAKAVAGVLDDVVRNLENLREVEAKLMQVGRKHAIFNDLGFHINFWSVFAEAFIDCTLEWGEKNRRVEESRKAWAIIIAYITDKMKFGFQEARRDLARPGRRSRQTDGSNSAGSSVS